MFRSVSARSTAVRPCGCHFLRAPRFASSAGQPPEPVEFTNKQNGILGLGRYAANIHLGCRAHGCGFLEHSISAPIAMVCDCLTAITGFDSSCCRYGFRADSKQFFAVSALALSARNPVLTDDIIIPAQNN